MFAGRSWKGDILIADLEDLEKLDASDICPRRINAKEVLIRQNDECREPTPRREPTVRSQDLSGEIQGESGESQLAGTADDAEALSHFWSIQGDFIYRHHNEPRVELCVPKE